MAKRHDITKIKKNLTYSTIEAAESLGVTPATVRNWVSDGLPIQKDRRPHLIYGEDLRAFLQSKQASRRYELKPDELTCFRCHTGRPPKDMKVCITPQAAKTSRLEGICNKCEGRCSRVISNARMPEFEAIFKITQANPFKPKGDPQPQPKFTLH